MGSDAPLNRSWRSYLTEMLEADLADPDLTAEGRAVIQEALTELSSAGHSVHEELKTELPPRPGDPVVPDNLGFLLGYPADLRERVLQRLKANGTIA
jgi:hypothetical protein